jgi:hypothetical protein
LCWTPSIRAQFVAKKQWPYARVAKFLHERMQKDDVIVAGLRIGTTLSQFLDHPEDRIMLPNSYVNKIANQLDARVARRVFYVTGQGAANGRTAPIRHFGQVEVTIYTSKTARALLQEWREDLLRRTAGRVVAAFQGDYQLLALIEERLPSGQSADQWRSLAERCRAENPAPHAAPRYVEKVLKGRRAVIFP